MAIQWDNLQHRNLFADFTGGMEAGRKIRTERETRNALNVFAQDPDAGAAEMIRIGRPDLAASSMTAREGMDKSKARRAAAPHLERGDYKGASRAVGGLDPNMARQFETWDRENLDHVYKMGKRGAGVLMAASNLPDPQQRRAYIDQHAEELQGYGMPAEKIAGYDVTDPLRMRADAARFMELSETAGKITTEKFGDYAVTYQTDPIRGTRAVNKTEIPPTRAERRQEAEFQYRQQQDGRELSLRERELQLRQFVAENPDSSPAKVMGPIFRKLASGGRLTAGEQEALRYYKLDPITAGALGETGGAEEYGSPSTPAAPPARGGKPAAAPPAAGGGALPPQAASQLKAGHETTFANGQVWTLRNGQPVRVK